jgi:hypothetical protein
MNICEINDSHVLKIHNEVNAFSADDKLSVHLYQESTTPLTMFHKVTVLQSYLSPLIKNQLLWSWHGLSVSPNGS